MKAKIIVVSIWVIVSILYCLNLADIGRSIGANTNQAIEMYSEMVVKYGGTTTDLDHLGDAVGDTWSYSRFGDLSKKYKTDFTIIGLTTTIYIGATILCYSFGIKNKIEK